MYIRNFESLWILFKSGRESTTTVGRLLLIILLHKKHVGLSALDHPINVFGGYKLRRLRRLRLGHTICIILIVLAVLHRCCDVLGRLLNGDLLSP